MKMWKGVYVVKLWEENEKVLQLEEINGKSCSSLYNVLSATRVKIWNFKAGQWKYFCGYKFAI